MISIKKIISDVLEEQNIAGGVISAFGPGVASTATQFSGDTYATGDARVPRSLFGGKMFRRTPDILKRKKRRKKK
jgi:hypothetical protein